MQQRRFTFLDDKKRNFLQILLDEASEEIAERLFNEFSSDIAMLTEPDKDGETLLMRAVLVSSKSNFLNLLLGRLAQEKDNFLRYLNAQTNSGNTPLHLAISAKAPAKNIAMLINVGASLYMRNQDQLCAHQAIWTPAIKRKNVSTQQTAEEHAAWLLDIFRQLNVPTDRHAKPKQFEDKQGHFLHLFRNQLIEQLSRQKDISRLREIYFQCVEVYDPNQLKRAHLEFDAALPVPNEPISFADLFDEQKYPPLYAERVLENEIKAGVVKRSPEELTRVPSVALQLATAKEKQQVIQKDKTMLSRLIEKHQSQLAEWWRKEGAPWKILGGVGVALLIAFFCIVPFGSLIVPALAALLTASPALVATVFSKIAISIFAAGILAAATGLLGFIWSRPMLLSTELKPTVNEMHANVLDKLQAQQTENPETLATSAQVLATLNADVDQLAKDNRLGTLCDIFARINPTLERIRDHLEESQQPLSSVPPVNAFFLAKIDASQGESNNNKQEQKVCPN